MSRHRGSDLSMQRPSRPTPRAQIRPIHRPPRRPRRPTSALRLGPFPSTPSHTPPVMTAHTEQIGRTAAVTVELSPIDHGGDGRADYSGPVVVRPEVFRLLAISLGSYRRGDLRAASSVGVGLSGSGSPPCRRRQGSRDHAKAIDRNRGSCGTAYFEMRSGFLRRWNRWHWSCPCIPC